MICIALQDERISNSNQTLTLASKFAKLKKCNVIQVKINTPKIFSLPNILLYLIEKFGVISKQKLVAEEFVSCYTHILAKKGEKVFIFSCGRKSAFYAFLFKKIYPNLDIQIVQILNPNLPFHIFHKVLLPYHDNQLLSLLVNLSASKDNVVRFHGSFSFYSKSFLKEKILPKKVDEIKAILPGKTISIVIGGNSKHFTFTIRNLVDLLERAKILARASSINEFIISTSPRTPKFAREVIIDSLKGFDSFVYIFEHAGKDPERNYNPYKEVIFLSDIVIVTADSISVCSEVCGIGKKVLVYTSNGMSKKYKNFSNFLFEGGYAMPLKKVSRKKGAEVSLDDFKGGGSILQEADRIATLI